MFDSLDCGCRAHGRVRCQNKSDGDEEVRVCAQHHLPALTTHVIDQSTRTNDPRNHSRYSKTTDTVVAISSLITVNPKARSHKYKASDYDNNPQYIRISRIGKKKET